MDKKCDSHYFLHLWQLLFTAGACTVYIAHIISADKCDSYHFIYIYGNHCLLHRATI